MNNVLELIDVKRKFVQGDVTIEVLRGVDLRIGKGELVALLGPSGSGKSTMLQAIGLLEGGFSGLDRSVLSTMTEWLQRQPPHLFPPI